MARMPAVGSSERACLYWSSNPTLHLPSPRLIGPPARLGLLGSLDHFDLIRQIGEGGMGLVYLAQDIERGELVAIKILKPDLAQDPRAIAYFIHEANHVRQLQHPHILPVFEFKESSEGAYLVMPYLESGSLDRVLKAKAMFDDKLMLITAQQVAAALHFAHQHGIIHRDLKPSNILLKAKHHAFLADFGLARSLMHHDSVLEVNNHHWVGTVSYLSPATAEGQQDDTRGDIYSFGAVLYEMLTGRPPYMGNSKNAVIAQILAGPPQPIKEFNPHAMPGLVQVAEGAMARELCNRYVHMSDVEADLNRVMQGLPPLGP